MSSFKVMFVWFILSTTTACSLLSPFVDRRRNAGESDLSKLYVGRSTPDGPAICSNGLWASKAKIQSLADEECAKYHPNTHAVQTDVSHFTCKLLLPTHTYFKCER